MSLVLLCLLFRRYILLILRQYLFNNVPYVVLIITPQLKIDFRNSLFMYAKTRI